MNELIKKEGLDSSSGFFNGHYVRTADNDFLKEYFPIPVITIKNLCDIEIGLKYTTITSKLSRDDALGFPFEHFQIPFEAYGVNDFQSDLYHKGMSLEALRENIEKSKENQIFMTFFHDKETKPETIIATIKTLKSSGYFY